MGTGQQNGIDVWRLRHYLVKVFFHKVISTGLVIFAIFNQRHPKRAGLLVNFYIGEKIIDF